MTPPGLAARVADLLDAGCVGHVRDLFLDLAAGVGRPRAARAVREAVVAWQAGRILAWADTPDAVLREARRLRDELRTFESEAPGA